MLGMARIRRGTERDICQGNRARRGERMRLTTFPDQIARKKQAQNLSSSVREDTRPPRPTGQNDPGRSHARALFDNIPMRSNAVAHELRLGKRLPFVCVQRGQCAEP